MELIGQGLLVTAVGMGVVFAFLSLLVLATLALGRFCREDAAAAKPAGILNAAALPDREAEIATAIAAAVHAYRRTHS